MTIKKTPQLDPSCKAVKRIREKLGETQEAFARRLGVAIMTISKFETGYSVPKDPRILNRLSGAAYAAGCLEEYEQFFAQFRDTRRPPPASTPYELTANSPEQWRLMVAAKVVATHHRERIAALEEALGPALQIVDSVLEGGAILFGDGKSGEALDRALKVLGDYWAQKTEEKEEKKS